MIQDVSTLLRHLVSMPSLSGEESEIADFVESWTREAGLEVGRVENNVFCSIGQGATTLLLNSHLDVVPPSKDHPFNPFDPVIGGERIFGRGTVDAKASGAAMLIAALNLSKTGWQPENGKLIVALTACEETPRPKNGLQTLLPHLPALDGAVVGEPTSLLPCFSQKGLLILEVTAHGKSAHAARPEAGKNAIAQAAMDIGALERMTFGRVHPQLGAVTKVVTTITGGSARNVIPERCHFVIDLRTTPSYTHSEIIEEVRAALVSDVEVSSERYVPTETPAGSIIATAVRLALPEATPFGSPTVSDWAFLWPVPAVKLGPGDSTLSHTGQESIAITELEEAVSLYETVVRHFFDAASATTNRGEQSYALEERR